MEATKGIAEILRSLTEAKVTVPLLIAAVVFVMLPETIISRLGVARELLGIAVIFLTAFNLTHVGTWLKHRYAKRMILRRARRRLESLTEPEKEILREFVSRGSRTANLDITNGVVNGLIEAGILWRSSHMTSGWGSPTSFAHNLYDAAWDELCKRPELLMTKTKSKKG